MRVRSQALLICLAGCADAESEAAAIAAGAASGAVDQWNAWGVAQAAPTPHQLLSQPLPETQFVVSK